MLVFDTLLYTKKLRDVGVPQPQAEVHAEAIKELVANDLATKHDLKELEVALKRDMKELEVALKRDMKELEVALKSDMKELEVALKSDMKELELRLTIRLGTMMTIAVGTVAVLVKLL